MDTVKNRRVEEGVYEFSYKDQKILAKRLPDLYFSIELDGKPHKGYLKDLKALFQKHIDGGSPAPDPAPAATPERDDSPGQPAPALPGPEAEMPVLSEMTPEKAEKLNAKMYDTIRQPLANPGRKWNRRTIGNRWSIVEESYVFSVLNTKQLEEPHAHKIRDIRADMAQATEDTPCRTTAALYWPVAEKK